jgi:hypothetical protein
MSGTSGSLENAVDAYSRAVFQMWSLPWKVWEVAKGATTLQSTLFSVGSSPGAGSRYRLALSKPLAPGIPYAKLNEALPESAVQFDPPMLGPGESTFRLLIEGHALHHRPGATYWGEVTVTDEAGGQPVPPPVKVWLVVS